MNTKLTLAIVLLVSALADIMNTNITPAAAQELLAAGRALNEKCGSAIINNTDATTGFPFVITVNTGDDGYAGTGARVYIIMYGPAEKEKVEENSGKIWLEGGGKFNRNSIDVFKFEVAKMISPISKIEIGHDDTGKYPGWLLDSVTIYSPTTGIEQYFPCGLWLASDYGDKAIQRPLYEQMSMRKKREINWQAVVLTSVKTRADTEANVFIRIYGDKSKSSDIQLDDKEDNFEQGKIDTFNFTTPDVGKVYKIRVWQDNSGQYPGWHLQKIELQNLQSKEKYTFNCDHWLSEDEGGLVREIPAEA